MALTTDKEAIIKLIQPLVPSGVQILAVSLISTEPAAAGLAKSVVDSGVAKGFFSSVRLGGVGDFLNRMAKKSSEQAGGGAHLYQFYAVATSQDLKFFTAEIAAQPRLAKAIPYADIVSVALG